MRQRIRINPIRCDAFGYCAELFPERITLDDWGYPILSPNPFGAELAARARRAVRDCPRLALLLEEMQAKEPSQAAPSRRRRPTQEYRR